MPDLFAPLSPDQQTLIHTMSDAYLRDGQWPVWDFVKRTLYLKRLDAQAVLRSLPKAGSQDSHGASYGLAWYDRIHLADDARPSLTIAAGLHLPDFNAAISRPFLLVLGTMVDMERNAPFSSQEITRVEVDESMIKRALPSISDLFMARLPDLLDHEPPTYGGGMRTGDFGDWVRGIRREILDYQDVRDLRAYVERVTELLPEPPAPQPLQPVVNDFFRPSYRLGLTSTVAAEPEPEPQPEYVDASLIKELEDAETTWHVGKLVGLIQELNSNFADENQYASHALLRAILDHVPPVFGVDSFDKMVNNLKWSRTDKNYVVKLKDFRTQGDDVMHRPIRTSADLIKMPDMPSRSCINALLRCCIDAL